MSGLDGWVAGSWQAVVCALLCRILFTPSAHWRPKFCPPRVKTTQPSLNPLFYPESRVVSVAAAAAFVVAAVGFD